MLKSLKHELQEEFIVSDNNGFTLFKIKNKQLGIILGLLAYLNIMIGAIDFDLFRILVGFLVCLPICYLQMEKHREIEAFIKG